MLIAVRNNFDKVAGLISTRYGEYPKDYAEPYLRYFLDRFGKNVSAIIFYGSCLNEVTKEKSSTPDFFVVTESYFAFYRNKLHAILNLFWTPNTYSIRDGELSGKYNVISLKDFRRETTSTAKDIYTLGRLSKRTAIAYYASDAIRSTLVGCFASGYYEVASKAYSLLGARFNLDDLVRACIKISYIGERRVEAADKVDRLIKSENEFYYSVYRLIASDMSASGAVRELGNSTFEKIESPFSRAMRKLSINMFIRRSRLRAKLRWPKSIYTFEGWVDTLIKKIERTKGIKIELTEKERKYPLIYCWKYYFRLKKDKLLK